MSSTRDKQKQAGHELFLMGIPSNEIARILDVSTTTVSNWTNAGNWHEERADSLSRKKNRMDVMADVIDYQLEALSQRVQQNRKVASESPDALMPMIDKGEVDALAKLFATIKGKELSWANMVGVVREVVEFLNARSPDLAKAIIPFTDDFLNTKRESLQ